MAWFSHVMMVVEKIQEMKLSQLIAPTCFISMSFVSCTDNANRDDNNINNHPALDTVNIKPDTIKNFPLPLPDSTLKATDTVAQNVE